jgi:regulation of enolase protein 1 (concanavalin A-like superfamily)
MSTLILSEEFDGNLDARLNWFCPPEKWSLENGNLIIHPDAKTDFWQRTHYGFQNDNGHFLFAEFAGDFTLTTKVWLSPVHQYDQAGLMVRLSADFWLKTSIEFEPEESNRLGAVVTHQGYSDWSTQDVPKSLRELQFRIRREGDDYIVAYRQSDPDPWSQIRMAHLENAQHTLVKCGLYACSPIDSGFEARFEYLQLEIPA